MAALFFKVVNRIVQESEGRIISAAKIKTGEKRKDGFWHRQ